MKWVYLISACTAGNIGLLMLLMNLGSKSHDAAAYARRSAARGVIAAAAVLLVGTPVVVLAIWAGY